jgi:hypothetical protein
VRFECDNEFFQILQLLVAQVFSQFEQGYLQVAQRKCDGCHVINFCTKLGDLIGFFAKDQLSTLVVAFLRIQLSTLPFKKKHHHMRRRILLLLAAIFLVSYFGFDRWKGELNGGDAFGYYLHLPATLLYFQSDLSFEQPWAVARSYAPGLQKYEDARNGTPLTPTGRHLNKYPIGVPIMSLPFFALGHVAAWVTPYPADGFSAPYRVLMGLGTICWVLLGFWWLFGLLERYFSTSTAVVTTLTLGLATNLFYFTVYNNYMAHPYVFAAVCGLLHCTVRYFDAPSWRRAAWVGAAVGLVGLVRLHDLVVVAIPIFWGLFASRGVVSWVVFWFKNAVHVVAAVAAGAAVLFPQMAYFRLMAGQWYYYAYAGEKFNFEEPHIVEGLTSFSNGWFIYTPVMVFSILGIVLLRRRAVDALVPILVILPIHVFVTYSWWCWNYVNGFGSRPMVDLYPLLAFPLAAFFQVWSRFLLKKMFNWLVLLVFGALNIFQTWQNDEGIIWSEMENNHHFWAAFGQYERSKLLLATWDSDERQYADSLPLVQVLAERDMEDSTSARHSSRFVYRGQYSLDVSQADTASLVIVPDSVAHLRAGDLIRASVWGYFPQAGHTLDRLDVANLIVSFHAHDGRELKRRRLRIAPQIGNPAASMWSRGDGDQWGQAAYYVRVPDDWPTDGFLNVHIQNERHERIWVDDLRVEHRRLR